MLTKEEEKTLNDLAVFLGVSRNALYALIGFESGWNTKATNPVTGARGLIQFMPSTARSMGYKDANDLIAKNPDRISQLKGPVRVYLSQYKPFRGDYTLFMAVFYPKARSGSPFSLFPEAVRKANPGINTPMDYVNKVYAHAGIKTIGLGALLVAGIIVYLLARKGGLA